MDTIRHKRPARRDDLCGNCQHFDDDPQRLEEAFPGINSLSSVRGCSRGDAGICNYRNLYLLPVHGCPDFLRKSQPS